ncbi:uncharacterized protein si:rp71-1d10.8 [Danio rerio]|uniref:Si:rp71-1d10.8 n=2 Tax=Danio rerio TaxID=7955 RepID=A0A0R4IN51_DANRE|nr:uncharacterized protein si:rp71-1d10.8 [Danio rerio]|eukprot:XP_005173216.1 uncharacterized protein si:rp71-1d10.8 [Danio rerio]
MAPIRKQSEKLQDERQLKGRKGLKMNQWKENQMKAAIEEYKVQVESGKKPVVRLLARKWNLPKTTFQRRLKGLLARSGCESGRTTFIPVKSELGELAPDREQRDESHLEGRKGLKMNLWKEDQMKGALEEYKLQVESGEKPVVRLLARKWDLPKTTLQRRLKGLVEGSEHASGRKPFIPVESERELANLLTSLVERGFLLRKTDVQSLAFEFAKINGIQGFSENKQKAGCCWFEGFMKRNPGLQIKKPEAISPATTMNEKELSSWFRMYKDILDALGIKDIPSHIWKCDLSELQDIFLSEQYVNEGEDPCFQINTEGETEEVSAVLAAFNACGTFAPLIIFKGSMVRNEWLSASLENMCMRASESGWITADMFNDWGETFVAQLPKDDTRPHLLLLDDQSRHVFNLSFLSIMNQNNVEVICYPALQQSSQALFQSLKHNWCEAITDQWHPQHEDMKLPKGHYCSVFMETWSRTATVERARDGFRTMGMFPINEFASIELEISPSTLEGFTASVEDEANCSIESGLDEPPAAEVASFKEFVRVQISSRHMTPNLTEMSEIQQDEIQLKGRKGLKMNLWKEDQMKGALEEYKLQVESGKKPVVRLLARKWKLPKTTLQRRVKGLIKGSEHASGRKPFIPVESERELSNLLTSLVERGFLLTKTDVQSLAFEFAKINGIQGFSEDKQKAGYYWFEGFMKRNPGLQIKKPEAISPATTMNEKELSSWFRMYKATLDALGIKDIPSHIWKCDLSELQDIFLSEQYVNEGEDPCFQINTEGETEEVSAVLAAFNACGTFAPLIIFKGSMVRNEWLSASLENMCMRASESGWITADMFNDWGETFVAQLPKDDTRPHLLLLDDQSRHVFNLSFLSIMNQNNVEVICYPALQQSSQALFQSLKHNWCEAITDWWSNQCVDMKLPKGHYCSVFMETWKKTATLETAQDGFRTMGMFPINEFASIEHELPSSTLESFTAPVKDEAHCSTESGLDETPAAEMASFKDSVNVQTTSKHMTPNLTEMSEIQQDEIQLKGRKGLRMNLWKEDQMKGALEEYKLQVESGKKPVVRLLARKWNLPKTTLQRRLKGLVEGSEHAPGRKPFIPVESERELANLLTSLVERGFLLRKTDVQSLAFEFAKINGIQGFSEDKQKAGYYWFEGFMKRNPGLQIKKPEAISPATTMNEKELSSWFRMYKVTLDALGIKDIPSHIWKCDLSELQDIFLSEQYVNEGEDPCFQINTEGETEEISALLAAFNACGTFAPLIIFKGSMVRNEWLSASLENMCMRASESGWITADMFNEWGEMFVAQLPKDDTRPHLLLLDDQSRHVFNLSFLSLMNQNNVEVICYPALQQSSQALFQSLKHNWCEAITNQWHPQHEDMKLPKGHYCSVFMETWKKTATVERAQSGFRTMGMFPINEFASIEYELSLSSLQGFTAPAEDEAHCSTGLNQPAAAEVASFKDFVVVQNSRWVKTPKGNTVPYLQENLQDLFYNEHLKQIRKTTSYNCGGCLIKHGTDNDPKASEAWIRCTNCKACYHESCAEEDGIYEWVSVVDH